MAKSIEAVVDGAMLEWAAHVGRLSVDEAAASLKAAVLAKVVAL